METNDNGYSSNPQYKGQQIPFDIVKLPSQGKLYPNSIDSIEVEYVTAEDENTLTSPNLIKSGKVLDVLMDKKIKNKNINPKQLLIGDRNAIMIFLRQSAYGDEYQTRVNDPSTGEDFTTIVDLTKLKAKSLNAIPNENMEFPFQLPKSKKNITFRLLTGEDEDNITQIAESKKNKLTGVAPYVTTRLSTQIMSIEGDRNKLTIDEFVRLMSPMDSLALREYIDSIEPGISMMYEFTSPSGNKFESLVNIDASFFWPSLKRK